MEEKEIRPKKIFEKFLQLAALDTKKFFRSSKIKKNCVACGKKGKFSFRKNNFSYYECLTCNTLFVNPRPKENEFLNYYTKSASIKYLANTLYEKTKKERRNKIFKPRAKTIFQILKKRKITNGSCVDIGGGYGIFAQEVSKFFKGNVLVIEPSPFLAVECKKKKLKVLQKFLETVKKNDLPRNRKIFTCFELIEHLYDPSKFIRNMKKLMSKEDLFIFTTLSSTGADILTLWNDSRSVNPPHHINFFNPKSIGILLKKYGLKILDITTPGKIDIDILENDKLKIRDRFWKTFISLANKSEKIQMQNLISKINFSSHMMVVCKK